ncbi:universal stress protein [bacterium]|nr:universal stress protein [bacterium]
MQLIKRILFPVDFSESSSKIVPYVQELGDVYKAEVHLLYVARSLSYLSVVSVSDATVSSVEEAILEGSQRSMIQFRDRYFKNYPNLVTFIKSGYAPEEILNYAVKNDISLIIMGTHGRRGLEKVIFGSVAEQVVKTSSTPVMVINPHRVKQSSVDHV